MCNMEPRPSRLWVNDDKLLVLKQLESWFHTLHRLKNYLSLPYSTIGNRQYILHVSTRSCPFVATSVFSSKYCITLEELLLTFADRVAFCPVHKNRMAWTGCALGLLPLKNLNRLVPYVLAGQEKKANENLLDSTFPKSPTYNDATPIHLVGDLGYRIAYRKRNCWRCLRKPGQCGPVKYDP